MSSGLECLFVERAPDEWYYVLEDGNAPKSAWDWREHATAYGPFAGMAPAEEHLRRNHANPGGHSIITHDDFEEDATYRTLFAKAQAPGRSR